MEGVELYTLGAMDVVCQFCGAIGFKSEKSNRNLPLSLGGVKNVMKGYCPPTSMGLPITLSPP